MAPEKTDERAMRIFLVIGILMMEAMDGDPARGSILEATNAENREDMLEPFGQDKPLVGQETMVAQVDAERAEKIQAAHRQRDPCPAEQPGNEGQECQNM